MLRLFSSRTFGIALCALAAVGLVLAAFMLIRGRDDAQSVILIVIELGGLAAGAGIIRRSALLQSSRTDSD